MASLVADYGTSSGSDSDSEENKPKTDKSAVRNSSGRNLLEAVDHDGDSDSDDESEKSKYQNRESAEAQPKQSLLPNPLAAPSKLPAPALESDRAPETSVFVTSFHRAAEAKSSILEQHVKMTDTDLPAEVAGKKICWNFRKGKCRFGHKCKYSHGHEILGHSGQPKTSEDDSTGSGNQDYNNMAYPNHSQQAYGHQWKHREEEAVPDEDDYLSNAKRKKRVGMSEGLVPPKRAMQHYDRFRQEERPWSMNK